jgi:hypothetical protein
MRGWQEWEQVGAQLGGQLCQRGLVLQGRHADIRNECVCVGGQQSDEYGISGTANHHATTPDFSIKGL